MVQLLGFQITRTKDEKDSKSTQAFTVPSSDDGTTTISAGGFFGQYLDMDVTAKNEEGLIRRYREIAQHPECDMAVEDIINEVIVSDERDSSVSISLDKLGISDKIKLKIRDEFDEILSLLNFDEKGHDIFKRWYIDGRIYFHKVINPDSPRKGITELRYIDPRKIKKIREVNKRRDVKRLGIEVIEETAEWFVYNERGIDGPTTNVGVKIAADTITYVTSGVIDQNKNLVLSHLHKAIKPVNQLRMIEDAVVIYRIVRAPERRIFYVDVGNLPKIKAESYLRDVMARYRNKLVYDASTGEIRDDRKHMSMLEDFWLPRREGAKGTEVTTLPGGSNLGEIGDVQYFQERLYRSLNVPISRMKSDTGFNLGKASEITRDELKFTKFIQRLRKRFTQVFNDILKTQLVLKGIITIEDWPTIKEHLQYSFLKDGYFAEAKQAEIMKDRIDLANAITPYVGKFYSMEYVRKNILRQTDEDIAEIDSQIENEIKRGIIASPEAEPMEDEGDSTDINIEGDE